MRDEGNAGSGVRRAGPAGKGDFSAGRVSAQIFAQALPLILAQFVQLIYNVVDRVYIGHMGGEEGGLALAGLGITFPVIALVAAFTNLFASGGAPLCAIARGRRDEARAVSIEAQTLRMQILSGVFVTVLCFFVMRPLLFLLGASELTYFYAQQYLSVYLLGTVFVMIGTGMTGFINLQGYPRYAMLATTLGAGINLALDPVFIFGLGMGVRGAALASVLSQAVSCVLVVRFLFGKRAVLPLRVRDLLKGDRKMVREIATLGLSGFVMAGTNGVVQAVCNRTLSVFGGDLYISVMTIINSVREMVLLPISGLSTGSQPVISYNYGAERFDRVRGGIRFVSCAGVLYTAAMWLLILLAPRIFLRLFSSDAAVVAQGRDPMHAYFIGFVFMALQFVGQSAFVALGRAKQAIFFSLLRKIIIVVPLTILLPRLTSLGAMGVFWAEPISNVIGGSAVFLTMYLTVYRRLPRESGGGPASRGPSGGIRS